MILGIKYSVAFGYSDTSFHLHLVLPLGGTADVTSRFPHHLHCTNFLSSADKIRASSVVISTMIQKRLIVKCHR